MEEFQLRVDVDINVCCHHKLGRYSYECTSHLWEKIEDNEAQLKSESSTGLSGCEKGGLRKDFLMHTIAFRYPLTGNHYLAITLSSLQEYICQWVGTARD